MLKKMFNRVALPAVLICSATFAAASDMAPDLPPDVTDARLGRVVENLRKIPKGDDLYKFGQRNDVKISWKEKYGGTQVSENITLSPSSDDPAASQILGHELRHLWQEFALKTNEQLLNPTDKYRLAQLREIDACAQEAVLAADRKDLTGEFNTRMTNGSINISYTYAHKPAQERDVIKDAYIPCSNYVSNEQIYIKLHFDEAFSAVKTARQADQLLEAGIKEPLEFFYTNVFEPIGDDKKRALFKSFFTLGIDPAQTIPQIEQMTPAQFDGFIDTLTMKENRKAEYAPLEAEFMQIKAKVAERLKKM